MYCTIRRNKNPVFMCSVPHEVQWHHGRGPLSDRHPFCATPVTFCPETERLYNPEDRGRRVLCHVRNFVPQKKIRNKKYSLRFLWSPSRQLLLTACITHTHTHTCKLSYYNIHESDMSPDGLLLHCARSECADENCLSWARFYVLTEASTMFTVF
jgi:hypothetical protein